jgi:UDP-3-O-[3-hydroxymyristoyl] glucosamine N-acyltransferase
MRLSKIAEELSGKIEGDQDLEISGVATLEAAQNGEISFLTNAKYLSAARKTRASAIIAGEDCPPLGLPIVRHHNPYLAFAKTIEIFHRRMSRKIGIHPTAVISDTATLGRNVSVGAFSIIGDHVSIDDDVEIRERCTVHDRATIGSGTLLHSGVVIRERVIIGRRCIFQNNCVIGSDGFGYAKQEDGSWYKIYQAGTVIIEDDVEVGAGSTIDRATLGETVIRQGVKIDNLVQVGHGSTVGSHTLLCAQVGLAGSTRIGEKVILAGQVGVAGHLKIGDGVIATAQTGIANSVEPNKLISGSPSFDHKIWLKSSSINAKLPQMYKSLKSLEKQVHAINNILKVLPEK